MLKEILDNIKLLEELQDNINQLNNLKELLKENNIENKENINEILNNENIKNILESILSTSEEIKLSNFIKYLIKVYKSINKETDIELIKLLSNKNIENKDRILKKFDRLVCKIANRYMHFGVEFEDLAQVGRLGLLKAYEVYDVNRNAKFITCAVVWVRQAIQREVRKNGRLVRLPDYVTSKIIKLNKVKNSFIANNGREPTDEELCDILDITIEELNKLYGYTSSVDSLDREIENDKSKNGTSISNYIPDPNMGPEELSERSSLVDEVQSLLRKVNLKYDQIQVLTLRYGLGGREPMTLEEIAKKFGVTRERIRQIEARALKKIKNSPYIKSFEVYVNGTFVETNTKTTEIGMIKKPIALPRVADKPVEETIEKKEGIDMNKRKTIFEHFGGFSEEEIREAVEGLSEEYKNVVYKQFGENLTETTNIWSTSERSMFYSTIRKKILNKLTTGEYEVKKAKTLFERIECDDLNVINKALETLLVEYRTIVSRKYGIGLTSNFNISEEDTIILNRTIIPALKQRCKLINSGKVVKPMRRHKKNNNPKKVNDTTKEQTIEEGVGEKSKTVEGKSEDKKIVPPPLRCFKNGYTNNNESVTSDNQVEISEKRVDSVVSEADNLKEIEEDNYLKINA